MYIYIYIYIFEVTAGVGIQAAIRAHQARRSWRRRKEAAANHIIL